MGSIGIQFTPTYTVGYVNRKSFVYGTDRIIPASDNTHTGQDRIIPARDNTQTGQDRTGQDHPPSHPVTTGEERTGSSQPVTTRRLSDNVLVHPLMIIQEFVQARIGCTYSYFQPVTTR